jgi:hypothetical protein
MGYASPVGGVSCSNFPNMLYRQFFNFLGDNMRRFSRGIYLGLFLLSSLAMASARSVTSVNQPDSELPFSKAQFEIGAAAGFPSVLGIQLGVWGPESMPILIRAVAGLGSQLDLGVHFPVGKNVENRLMVAASGGLVGYGLHTGSMLGSVGPSVGMRTGNFFFEAGPALYFSSSSTNIGAHGSVGLSALY